MQRTRWIPWAICGAVVALTAFGAGAVRAEEYSWQEPHARVVETGRLEWAPEPFVFEAGETVRYIDYENGSDAADGTTKQAAWKHHPWDAEAAGSAAAHSGPTTYVFKRGTIYRGYMRADESGAPADPIRLTSDPEWGEGEARIYGSVRIPANWKRCTPEDAPGIPEPEKVWYNDVGMDFDTDAAGCKMGAIWRTDGHRVVRLHIARDPNWTITDPDEPMSDWHRWETFIGTGGSGWLTDSRWTGLPADFFDGAVVWTQHRNLMGSVHRVLPQDYDPERGALRINSPGGALYRRGGDPDQPYQLDDRVGYYVENVAEFLDSPGEYFFQTEGQHAGRLYIRLDDDSNPNDATLEAAQVRCPIAIFDQSNIEVSGLSFSFNDDDDGMYGYPWYISASPGVRIVGNCHNITVRNCKFYNVMNAVVAFPRPRGGDSGPPAASEPDIGKFDNDVMGDIFICDNDARNVDMQGAIWVEGVSERTLGEPYGVLKRVEVMRNRVVNSGYRPGKRPTSQIPAICVVLPETAEIAGNIVDTSWGCGVFTLGGKSSGALNEVFLSRMLIHHNQADNTMLGCNDYGGIEIFQGGPAYLYNNVSRNCVGTKTFTGSPLAYNLYLDGAFKMYCFNNILAGTIPPDRGGDYGHCGYFMVFGFLNHLFNNTIYRFDYGLNGSSGNRSCILGNVMVDMSRSFMGQNRPGDVSMEFGGDTGEMGRIGIPTMVYGDNIFWGQPEGGYRGEGDFGYVGGTSTRGRRGAEVYTGNTLEELSDALRELGARVSSIGRHVAEMPLVNPAREDYRPTRDSAARESGVRFFVPWGLAAVVGEWDFYRSDANPEVVLGEHFYMQEEHMQRGMYYFIPRNDLTVNQCTPDDYVAGPLEDWIDGALRFDGQSRYAVLSHADMTRDVEYPVAIEDGRVARGRGRSMVYSGSRRKTLDMDTNNFLIECFFRTDPGHTGGTLASKIHQGRGYELFVNTEGRIALSLSGGGEGAAVTGPGVNDGRWHHVIAEVDRPAARVTFHVDGESAASEAIPLGPTDSLANPGDFCVGRGSAGYFAGAVDFLRVSRGTLADAKTTIDELYEWEFNGPFLRDFMGNEPVGRRDAGAIEFAR